MAASLSIFFSLTVILSLLFFFLKNLRRENTHFSLAEAVQTHRITSCAAPRSKAFSDAPAIDTMLI